MRADLEKIVWAAECRADIRSWKFVLLNLCHHANAEGKAFPSVATVARECGYSAKAVISSLEGLQGLGIITRTGGCGQKKRVGVYDVGGILTGVHKLGNGEVSSPLKPPNGEVGSPLKPPNSEVSSKKPAPNSELTSANSEVSSHRSILGNKELVSKLVSAGANSELTSPLVHKSGAVAPPARDYGSLVRTVGWKPATDEDRRAVAKHCFELGADKDQATKFIRFNAIRRWTCCEYGTVNDAAKEWVEKWREDSPEEFFAEAKRRKRRTA